MADFFRETPLGQLIRLATKNRFLLYPEEKPGFEVPASYSLTKTISRPPSPTRGVPLDTIETQKSENFEPIQPSITAGLERARTREDLERAFTQTTVKQTQSRPIEPQKTSDGVVLVDFYSTDDPANPQNWSQGLKALTAGQVYIYTLAVYMGSSIITPSEAGISEAFGVSPLVSSLVLSLYVLAYGIGPMIFSPLSEIPSVGRNIPYISSFFIFVILCIPTALVENFAGLLVLRFLQGFFGSPCLATGGASIGDLYSLIKLPYGLSLWAFAATCGPAFGPIISGFSVPAESWRWALWEMLWLAGPILVVMFIAMPETYPRTILKRRAIRLRKLTGNPNLKSQGEIDEGNLSFSSVAIESLYRPSQIMILDPAVGFTALYTALVYGIYYTFFEALPNVYIAKYGFNVGEMGLTFLAITVGVVVSIILYWSYVYFHVEPSIKKFGLGTPEARLVPALFASIILPIGLFMFAWTSNPKIHWIVSVIGIFLFTIGIFIVIQCVFIYLALTYPEYAASLFAGNDLTRSTLAAGAVLFAQPLYGNLGIGSGVSILAACTALCAGGCWGLWKYGATLRARSRFAAK